MLKNGRMGLNVVVLDEQGQIVALSNHVALIMNAARNLSARRGMTGKAKATESKI
jgi:hypothetical protein